MRESTNAEICFGWTFVTFTIPDNDREAGHSDRFNVVIGFAGRSGLSLLCDHTSRQPSQRQYSTWASLLESGSNRPGLLQRGQRR